MTENQQMLMAMVQKKPGEWVSLRGVCLVGKIGGRGIPQVVAGLVKRGLIEERYQFIRNRLHRCIRLKGE